jgi:hypothetical protein
MNGCFGFLAFVWLAGLGVCLLQVRRSLFVWLIVVAWCGLLLVIARVFFGTLAALDESCLLWWVVCLAVAVGFTAAAIDIRTRRKKNRPPAPLPAFPDADALRLWSKRKPFSSPNIQPEAEPQSDIKS